MAISPLMVFDHVTPQAHRLLNGATIESTQLGAALGVGAETAPTTQRRWRNRMCEFRRDLYVWHAGSVYRFTFAGATWSVVVTFASGPGTNGQAGLYLLEDSSGDLRMVAVWQTSLNTQWRVSTSLDGTTWTAPVVFYTDSGAVQPLYAVPYQGKLWITNNGSVGKVVNYDPVTGSAQSFTWPLSLYSEGVGANLGLNQQLLVFQGRLFWVGSNTSGANNRTITLLELVGGGFATVPISGGTDPGIIVTLFTQLAGAVGAFESAGNLYVVFWNPPGSSAGTLGQMRVIEFVPNVASVGGSFQENDISATVVPAAWRPGGAFANLGTSSSAVYVHVDVSSPGGPQVFWWRYDGVGSSASTFWTWNGNASLATVVNSIGGQYSLPQQFNSTGERIYTEGDFDVTLENTDTQPSKIFFDVTVALPLDGSTPAAKQGQLYYSVGGDDWQVATLASDAPTLVSGAGPAPTISVNVFQGVLVNGDKWRAAWDAPADGFSTAGLDFELLLDVF